MIPTHYIVKTIVTTTKASIPKASVGVPVNMAPAKTTRNKSKILTMHNIEHNCLVVLPTLL